MKFSRTRLRAAAERALAEDRARHDQRVTDWDVYLVRHRAAWIEKNAAQWRTYLAAATAALDEGRPVTSADVASGPSTWSEPYRDEAGRNRPIRDYQGPRELLQLVAVLDVVQDEDVTTAGLHALGITGSVMVKVSAYLARTTRDLDTDAA